MDSVYRGCVGGKLKAGYIIHWNWDRIVLSLIKHRNMQPQSTCLAKTIVGSSMTPHAAFLVLSSGTVYPVVNLQDEQNAACKSRPGYL